MRKIMLMAAFILGAIAAQSQAYLLYTEQELRDSVGYEMIITEDDEQIFFEWITSDNVKFVVSIREGNEYVFNSAACPQTPKIFDEILVMINDKYEYLTDKTWVLYKENGFIRVELIRSEDMKIPYFLFTYLFY